MKAWRDLIEGARLSDFTIAEDISKHIEAEFVASRQQDPASITQDDLLLRMTVAR